MESPAPWPINKYGTAWRHAVLYFDWQDEEIVSEVIDTINPLEIAVRQRLVAAIGFENIRDMVIHRLSDTLPYGKHWDADNMCIIIDPCGDPAAMEALVEEQMENVRFSVFGVARLDLADQATYRSLLAALEDRWERFIGEAPVIEF